MGWQDTSSEKDSKLRAKWAGAVEAARDEAATSSSLTAPLGGARASFGSFHGDAEERTIDNTPMRNNDAVSGASDKQGHRQEDDDAYWATRFASRRSSLAAAAGDGHA